MSNDLSMRVSMDTIRPVSPPRDTNGQMQAITPAERDISSASRQDVSIQNNDIPADSRNTRETNGSLLTKSINELASHAQSVSRGLKFTVDTELNKTVITVYDTATKTVIRQIPSEEILNFARTLEKGDAALIDVKA